ncbi:hypothetical protein [Lactococcus allomyrinae]|uniref:Uncharacterized protein n=1 Tax=Lactococcus allomyrinae TaxID=2419773 RepID=A0A387BG74_9LACT|nr:hypothetical protein [Lactococcus allomyrinae]AYF99839.1 hypothetical protein D7I46_01320 [Lactococcus allomyrinae]
MENKVEEYKVEDGTEVEKEEFEKWGLATSRAPELQELRDAIDLDNQKPSPYETLCLVEVKRNPIIRFFNIAMNDKNYTPSKRYKSFIETVSQVLTCGVIATDNSLTDNCLEFLMPEDNAMMALYFLADSIFPVALWELIDKNEKDAFDVNGLAPLVEFYNLIAPLVAMVADDLIQEYRRTERRNERLERILKDHQEKVVALEKETLSQFLQK